MSPAERGRRWPRWVAIAAGALVLAVVAFLLGTGHGQPSSSPTPSTPPPGGSGASVPASDLAGQPDGCLGGVDPYTAILPAQQQATLDAAGAVGFARSAFRYLVKSYPRPADAQTVLPQVFVNPAQWLANASKPNPDPAPAGTTTQYVRASETTYRVTAAGQTADVTVSLIVELDYPDGTNSQAVLTQRFLLQAVGGHWMIADAPATDPLPAAGAAGVFYVPGGC